VDDDDYEGDRSERQRREDRENEIARTIWIIIGVAVGGFLVWHLIAVGMQYQAYWNGR
jgi:hypothetical protein